MRIQRSTVLWLALTFSFVGLLADAIAAQTVRVRWRAKPEVITIPTDQIVGVSVDGPAAGTVWIADERAPYSGRLMLTPIAPGRFAVAMDHPKLARLAKSRKSGTLRVFAADARGRWSTSEALGYVWSERPLPITLPRTPAFFIVKQRSTVEVPGSRNTLRVRLGDITGGNVGLSLWTGRERYIRLRYVRSGDRISLPLARPTRLQVLRLVNLLFGDDYALLMVCADPPKQATLIEALIQKTRHAGLPIYAGEERLESTEVERRLRKLLAAWGEPKKTLAGFLDRCAKEPDLPTHFRWIGDKRKPFIGLLRRFAEALESKQEAKKTPPPGGRSTRRAG